MFVGAIDDIDAELRKHCRLFRERLEKDQDDNDTTLEIQLKQWLACSTQFAEAVVVVLW